MKRALFQFSKFLKIYGNTVFFVYKGRFWKMVGKKTYFEFACSCVSNMSRNYSKILQTKFLDSLKCNLHQRYWSHENFLTTLTSLLLSLDSPGTNEPTSRPQTTRDKRQRSSDKQNRSADKRQRSSDRRQRSAEKKSPEPELQDPEVSYCYHFIFEDFLEFSLSLKV